MAQSNDFALRVTDIVTDIATLLIKKNLAYGNSALEPKRVFSKASTTEQLLVRIDDKLSRIATTGESASDEDTVDDLIGYLILLKIAREDERKKPGYGTVSGKLDRSKPGTAGVGIAASGDYAPGVPIGEGWRTSTGHLSSVTMTKDGPRLDVLACGCSNIGSCFHTPIV